MIITGDNGNRVEAVYCGAANTSVVTIDSCNRQIVEPGSLAIELQPDHAPNIPTDCPLTKSKEVRDLGKFATACPSCAYSILIEAYRPER